MSLDLDYLKLVESHEKYRDFNVFEKVIMATQRAKAIYEEEKARKEEQEYQKDQVRPTHKPTYQAVMEINEGRLLRTYRIKKTPKPFSPSSHKEESSSDEKMTTRIEKSYQGAKQRAANSRRA